MNPSILTFPWSDSFFASFVLDQWPRSPYLKTDLVHWTIGSVLVGDGSGCTFARKNGSWQLLQTLLYQSHAYQQWQQWDLLSALVQTFVRLRQYSQNTLTIHAALIISEHIFLCWRVCFFLGILDISSPFIWLKVDRSQSLYYFVPQENITVKPAWKIKNPWWQCTIG